MLKAVDFRMKFRLLVLLVFFLVSVHGSGDGSGDSFSMFEDNLTLTSCAANSIQSTLMSSYSPLFSITLRIIQSILHIVISLSGIFLNLFLIVLVAKHPILHTVSLMVSLQIVVLDLILSLTLLAGFVSAAANQWLFGEHFCILISVIITTTTTARTVLLFAFVIDRFLSVFWAYFYPLHKTKIIITLSAISWLLCVINGIVQIPPFLDCYSFDKSAWICGSAQSCNKSCATFSALFIAIVIAPAMILPIILYTVLYCKAKKIRKVMAAHVDRQSQEEYYSNEWKATVTYGLLFTTVLVITVPNIVTRVIISNAYSTDILPPAVHFLSVLCLHSITVVSISDPLVILRNAEMREIISKLKRDVAIYFARNSPSVHASYN